MGLLIYPDLKYGLIPDNRILTKEDVSHARTAYHPRGSKIKTIRFIGYREDGQIRRRNPDRRLE